MKYILKSGTHYYVSFERGDFLVEITLDEQKAKRFDTIDEAQQVIDATADMVFVPTVFEIIEVSQ